MRSLSLSRRNFKEIYRDPVTALLGVGLPIAFILLFSSIYERTRFHVFHPTELTPGVVIFSFAFLMMFSATLMAKDRQGAFLMRLLSTPLRPRDFILAYFLPFLVLSFIIMGCCLLTGYLIGADFHNVAGMLLILFLISIVCIGMGMIMGSLLSVNQVSGIGGIVITVVSLFGNIWTPLEIMGGAFKTIGYSLPFAHASDATRIIVKGGSLSDVIPDLLWILIYAIVMILAGVLAFAWKTRPK